jgi:hypothetical protein
MKHYKKNTKKKTKSLWYIILVLIPFTLTGQNYLTYEDQINKVDIKISQLITQRKINRAKQDKINDFIPEVGRWFDNYSNIQTKIKEAKGQYGNYGSFDNQKLERALQQLEQERITVYNLNGGTTIHGVTYYSIGELQSAMTTKSKEVVDLINDDEKITIALQTADRERDRLVSQLEESDELDNRDNSRERWNGLKIKLYLLESDYKRDSYMLNSPNFWCASAANSKIKCVHRKYYVAHLITLYTESLIDNLGKKYDQKELADMIIQARDNSNDIKRNAQSEIIFETLEQIKSIKQQLKSFTTKVPLVDPSGCWVILIGSGRKPVITIQENSYGEFDAYITDPGSLNYKRGKRLFTMARINATTFEGTEYSYSKSSHSETRIPVRLIIQKNRSSIEYRTSDDLLTLLPCR